MKTCLILHLSAPLMSFGNVRVDRFSPTSRAPHISMLTGLLANALGWSLPDDAGLHDQLQRRISMTSITSVESLRRPPLADIQTVRFPKSAARWTTAGAETVRTTRRGPKEPPYVRTKEYIEDASIVVALSLSPEEETPRPDDLARALRTPARPLYIGRRSCIPQTPLLAGIERAADPLAAALKYRRLCARDDDELEVTAAGKDLPPTPEDALIRSETSGRNWRRGGLHGGEIRTCSFTVQGVPR